MAAGPSSEALGSQSWACQRLVLGSTWARRGDLVLSAKGIGMGCLLWLSGRKVGHTSELHQQALSHCQGALLGSGVAVPTAHMRWCFRRRLGGSRSDRLPGLWDCPHYWSPGVM